MFNILGQFKPITEEKPCKIRLDLDYPLFSNESIREDSQVLRLLEDVAKIGLLEPIEIPLKTKTIRNVTITKDGKVEVEEVQVTMTKTKPTIKREDVSSWIKNRHKYLTKTQPYSDDIIHVIKQDLGLELSSDLEFFLRSMIERNFFNLTPKQLYLKNWNKRKKYDMNGNRIR